MDTNKYIVLIPCAGVGARLNATIPKQYLKINGITILEHTIKVFLQVQCIDQIVIIINESDNYINQIKNLPSKVKLIKSGAEIRAQTVINGLKLLDCNNSDWILVHDAARCCITATKIEEMIATLKNDEVGGVLAVPATDTIKSVEGNFIQKTWARDLIYLAQTPQMFRYGILTKALLNANLSLITDEASAIEQAGLPVQIIKGDSTNIKVTYPIDIKLAQIILNDKLI